MNQKHYNTIIIGGGIAGLFSAYNISKVSSQTFCILEKNK